jgi:hypothetical protein
MYSAQLFSTFSDAFVSSKRFFCFYHVQQSANLRFFFTNDNNPPRGTNYCLIFNFCYDQSSEPLQVGADSA